VVVLDEAQELSRDALEQIRLLTNLETNTKKLLQIILLGQPELRDMLKRKELRQLNQRITARFHLDALNHKETEAYLRHRYAVAGGRSFPFHEKSVRQLFRISGGIPRSLNLLADRSLLAAYVQGRFLVSDGMVKLAASEVLPATTAASLHWPRILLFSAAVAIVAGLFLLPRWWAH
jgi:general secretion pathway protein A